MSRPLPLVAALLLGFAFTALPAQAAPIPCSVAVRLDADTYNLLALGTQVSEAATDQSSFEYAGCQAARLGAQLAQSPQLRERLGRLRTLYRQLRAEEGGLAYVMAGGGTIHTHAVPRSYPALEQTLSSLAVLASSSLGAQVGPQYAGSLTFSRTAFNDRLSALKAWKPKDAAATGFYVPKTFQADVAAYAQTGAAIMKLLGSRDDAATAAGYLPLQTPLFVDEYLNQF
ncbi:hypothetical protein [Deinococcus rubellus]|uniref:Uncharacterized protein n=1 Tax=Deinococcus rubellus TaxID=1889240 RepID=A0ABY5YLX4_9DEIO|nr:hypothetical protein [Deinococcus rubellus]UWX65259.1 hypothetical protein N0D28_06285 [Deinococcus rubellus]